MLILSRVCAEFYDKNGGVIYRITPEMLGLFHNAPEAIKGDPLFNMLLADGSIKTPEDAEKDRELEHNPMAGAYADGKEKPGTKLTDKTVKNAKTKAEDKPAEEKSAETNTQEKPAK